VGEFKVFNRSLDKESRRQVQEQYRSHKLLFEVMLNPKKGSRLGSGQVNELKNRLFHYDVREQKLPIQYTPANQPVFRANKMLRPYQLESLNWLIESWYEGRNVILADEMGLGKTIQSVAFLNHIFSFENSKGPFLVIAPLSTLDHWKRTVEDWTSLNCLYYYDSEGQQGRAKIREHEWYYTDISMKGTLVHNQELHKFHVLVTSYEVFLQDHQAVFQFIPFQYIIVDEAHRLKNQNAKIIDSLRSLCCRRVLLLTGTPIQNNTTELWSLLHFIEPATFPSMLDFSARFGELTSVAEVDRLNKELCRYLLRRKKEDVERSIPPLQETIIDIEMTNLQKTIYRALYEKNKGMLMKGVASTTVNATLNNL
jgi:chromodomain-helicase-DNA-binding protein 7